MQKFQDVVLDSQGRPVAGAVIAVLSYPGGSPATVYQTDAVGAAYTPTTDDYGAFYFYAPNGNYSYTVTVANVLRKTVTDVILYDPEGQTGSWTPSVSSSSGTIDTVLSSEGTYLKTGGLVRCTFNVSILFNGTGSGSVNLGNLPFACADIYNYGQGQKGDGTLLFVGGSSATFVPITTFAGTYPGGDGATLQGYFQYAAA